MNSLSVSKFKWTCHAVVEEVAKFKQRMIITKRGKPVAELIPYEAEPERVPLKETVPFMGGHHLAGGHGGLGGLK